MPQLDPTWFASSLFWLAVCMGILYVTLSRWILPPLMNVIEQRRKTHEWDLSLADEMKIAAEHVRRDYEKALADARLRAQAILAEAERTTKQSGDRAAAELHNALTAQTAEAEKRIAAQRDSLMTHLEPAAAELAALAVARLTGIKPDMNRARAIVAEHRKGA